MPDTSWKQMIRMRRLFISVRRSFRPVCPVGRVGFEVKELTKNAKNAKGANSTKSTKNLQDYHNPFLELPNELLLMITKFLEKEFQLTLSLSCRRLRILLNSSLDLSLCDIS